VNCAFDYGIDLSDARTIGIDLISGTAATIRADRLTAEGSVRITKNSEPKMQSPRIRQLRLCGAKVRGNLNLRGCQLGDQDSDGEAALLADGLAVEGNVFLSNGFTARGEVCLDGCKITRDLDCSGASLCNWEGDSLSAVGANISGSVHLRLTNPMQFISEGTVRFEGTKIEGDFDCSGGRFIAPAFGIAHSKNRLEEADLLA